MLNNTLWSNLWVIEGIRKEVQNFLESNEKKTPPTKTFGI
jgi:hypothetical protein